MKITKRQLRRIIREERTRLYESVPEDVAEAESLQDQLLGVLETMNPMERAPIVRSLIEELEIMARN